jgi:hypothetical protein
MTLTGDAIAIEGISRRLCLGEIQKLRAAGLRTLKALTNFVDCPYGLVPKPVVDPLRD